MKSLEELLQPVRTPDGWSLADQFKKMVEENQEVGEELRKYYEIMVELETNKNSIQLLLQKQLTLTDAAHEAGDVILAAIKLIDLIGIDLKCVLSFCHFKNEKRGYYSEGAK